MFDFANLDDIEDNAAAPEWLKWQGIRWQRDPQEELPVLVEEREETFAAPAVVQGDFTWLPVAVPSLPDAAFDPLALASEKQEVVEGNMASLNGQVIVNFATSAVEEFMLAQREREEYKAYIQNLHEQRLAYLAAKRSDDLAKRGIEMRAKGAAPTLDRKPFAWRELRSVLNIDVKQMPKDSVMAETVLSASKKLTRSLVPIATGAMLPPSILVHMLVAFGSQVRPEAGGRWGRNAAKHIAVSDCFFPTGMILNDAADIINQKKEPPTLVHLVAMSINKENGDLEAKHLLDNIKLPSPASYPSIKPRHQIRR
ncbi:unnamed protein product [Symbiodinium natans]|uniref:Uncharacterized protein n=1 Tax=Symbiodinium natans TaxID=878477 RepID=A0A812T7Q6_9DINO|nr:unnamed protein product [Symbiodinium natans]